MSLASVCTWCGKPTDLCNPLADFRESQTEEGRAKARERYQAEARRRVTQAESPDLTPDELRRKMTDAGVAHGLAKRVLEPIQEAPATKAAQQFIADRQAKALLLLGPRGVGKSLACALVVLDEVKRYPWKTRPSAGSQMRPIVFTPASSFAVLDSYGEGDTRMLLEMERALLLVIDDIGGEASERATTHMVETMKRRLENGRRTCISSNLFPKDFAQRYGEPLVDRIRSEGYSMTVEPKGDSRRGVYAGVRR